MCGIAGIAGVNHSPDWMQEVQEMCGILHHRGPDDQGIRVGNRCVLGQTRLSIIDIDGGHQPLCNEDESVWVTFNGEIYNYLELRQDLILQGHQFKTQTDTEVLVHLYEQYGIEFVKKLNGMFAFALWDGRSQTLYLVRDHLGIKPLYYTVRDDNSLSFSSELKALLTKNGKHPEIDKEALAEYLTLSYIPAPRSPFKGILKLKSGSYLEFSKGILREKEYWKVPSPSVTDASLHDLREQLRFLLMDSVRLQLRADVPVGIFASGGLDSTVIMWAASKQKVSLNGFLAEFDSLAKDTPYARLAAKSTGMSLSEVHLSSAGAGELLPRLIWFLDEPLGDPAIVPCYLISSVAAKSVKVILNGTGGDELFGGYPRYNVRGLLPGNLSLGMGRLCSNLSSYYSGIERIGALLDYRVRYLRRLYVYPEKEARQALGLDGVGTVQTYVNALFKSCASNDISASMMYVDLNLYLPGDLFMLLDKMTMATSLEARVPLLDHRLVEYMAGIPGSIKMRGKELKWLLRSTLRGEIPDQILDRPKQGFGPPVSAWINTELGSSALKLLRSKNACLNNYLDPHHLQKWLEKVTSNSGYQIWSLLVFELWLRIFTQGVGMSGTSVQELATQEGTRWI